MRHIQNPAGLRALESLIQFITDKDSIAKVLRQIHDARDEANAKIAVVGKIDEIDALNAKASEALAEASIELTDAKTQAKRILGKAGKDAAAEKARQNRADSILAAQEARDRDLTTQETNVAARESELQVLMDQVRTQRTEVTELEAQAEALITKANEQLAAFERFSNSLQ